MRVSLDIRSGSKPGKVLDLVSRQTVQIGRSSEADLSIPEDQKLSRLHFALVCDAESCTIRDLDSRNGILVNNSKVTEAVLKDGDVIIAGGTTFVIQLLREEQDVSAVPSSFDSAPISQHVASGSQPSSPYSVFQHQTTAYTQPAIQVTTEPPPWESGIHDPDPLVRKEALFAAAWMRQPWLLDHCRNAATTPSLEQWSELYLLAILGQPGDVETILSVGQSPELGAQRFKLLSVLGHPRAMDAIFTGLQSDDPCTTVAAGLAFTKMTGIDIESDTRVTVQPEDGTEPDEFEQEFLDEVTLPSLALAQQHWDQVKESFLNGSRWCRGFDLNKGITDEILAELDLESRWETCLRGKYSGTWTGSLIDLEIFPQKPLPHFSNR